jgi:hypothetical protein
VRGEGDSDGQLSPDDLFQFFGDKSGNKSNYEQLDASFRSRLTEMAKQYKSVTGERLGFTSGQRDTDVNAAVGGVSTSKHISGTAVDLSTKSVEHLKQLGLLTQYGFKQGKTNKAHISDDGFARGGIATGPKSGYNTLLHGTEAVVPLPDGKTIPVSMNQSSGSTADNTELLQVMREVKSSIESMTNRADNQRVVAVLEDSIRAQRTSNDILGKILQMSQ